MKICSEGLNPSMIAGRDIACGAFWEVATVDTPSGCSAGLCLCDNLSAKWASRLAVLKIAGNLRWREVVTLQGYAISLSSLAVDDGNLLCDFCLMMGMPAANRADPMARRGPVNWNRSRGQTSPLSQTLNRLFQFSRTVL